MAYTVKILPFAYDDLINAKDWYNEQRENLGEEFKAAITTEIDYISRYPDHYQYKFQNLRQAVLRRFPYVIYYLSDANSKQVVIFGVLHSKRNPNVLLKRIR